MVLCLLNVWIPSDLWVFLFIGVMATVTADTWATELGALAGSPAFRAERQVLTAGESGGVSWVGSTAAAGSLLIGAGGWRCRMERHGCRAVAVCSGASPADWLEPLPIRTSERHYK